MSDSLRYRPNIILITFDSLAARNMSLYGYSRVTTPHLDAFARKSFVFKNVFANCNSTIPSLVSILTGNYPFSHNCRHGTSLFGSKKRSENIASVLKKEGYHISAVLGTLSGYPIVPRLPFTKTTEETRGLKLHLPFWREYLVRIFSTPCLLRWSGEITRLTLRTNSPDSTFKKAVDRLQTLSSPFFLWIHTYPPHAPYLPSPEFKYAFLAERTLDNFEAQKRYLGCTYPKELQPVINKLRSRYDELILSADKGFRTFGDALRHQGYLENSIVIITSDHGEMFERGYQGHDGTFLYQPMVHIPLIIRLPKQQDGRVLAVNAEQIDIAPTLLDMLGLKIPSWMEGESLKKAMEQFSVRSKPKFSMSVDALGDNGGFRTGSIAVSHEQYKLVFHLNKKDKELFDLSNDPGEQSNLFHLKKEEARFLENMVSRRMSFLRPSTSHTDRDFPERETCP